MMKIQWTGFIAAVLTAFSCNLSATAGVITGQTSPATGPGLGFASIAAVATPNSNNDNVPVVGAANDNNVIVPLKRFDATGYIDIPLSVTDSNGTTEYTFTEFVDNNTGTPWSSLRMELGLAGPGGTLLPVGNASLDFDTPDNDTPPSSAAFTTVSRPDNQTLLFSGGFHGAGAQQYTFRVDVPDGVSRAAGFVLRETPTADVPEPGSLVLVAVACGLAGAMRRRG